MLQAIVDAATGKAFSKLMEYFSDWPTYFSPNLKLAWKVLIVGWGSAALIALTLLTIWSLYFRFENHKYRDDYLARTSPSKQELAEKANIEIKGYKTVARLPLRQEEEDQETLTLAGSEAGTSPGRDEELIIQTREHRDIAPGAVAQEVSIIYPDAEETLLDYLVLQGQFVWAPASDTHFEGLPVAIPFEDALNQDFVRDFFSGAQFLFCFGLASSEVPRHTQLSNTKLSDRRALHLCQALVNLGIVDPTKENRLLLGVSFGEHVKVEGSSAMAVRSQRSVLAVSIREPRRVIEITDIARALDAIFSQNPELIGGVQLSNYSRDDDQDIYFFSVAHGGPYQGFDRLSTSPMNLENEMNKIISAQPEQ